MHSQPNLKVFRILRRELLPAKLLSERHLASSILSTAVQVFRRSRRSTPRCLHRVLHSAWGIDMRIERLQVRDLPGMMRKLPLVGSHICQRTNSNAHHSCCFAAFQHEYIHYEPQGGQCVTVNRLLVDRLVQYQFNPGRFPPGLWLVAYPTL